MELLELVENELVFRPFQCDWDSCNKSFDRKADLRRHYKIHTNQRPYSCSIPGCSKRFIQRSALTVHIRTHTGEKPHQCQHMNCGKCFSDSSSLARHRRTHTGQRPYACNHDGCIKNFCRKTTMINHQRRFHRRDLHLNKILDSCSSDSDVVQASPTPSQSAISRPVWAAHHQSAQSMHHAASFPDQMDQYNMLNVGSYSVQQHPIMFQRNTQQPFYVVEQGNPGIATVSATMHPSLQTPRVHYSVGEMAYTTQGMTTTIISSRSVSPVVEQSPAIRDGICTQASQENFDVRHNAAVAKKQPMMHYTQQMPQQTQVSTGHYSSSHAESEQCYQYQALVDSATVAQLAAHGSGIHRLYGAPNIEFDDAFMQL